MRDRTLLVNVLRFVSTSPPGIVAVLALALAFATGAVGAAARAMARTAERADGISWT